MADYTYACARVKALESMLLSPSQVELLVSAKGTDELYTALYDSYLAPYLRHNTEHDILAAIEEQVSDTKDLLISIVPRPRILDILWIKYDYHNVMVIVKGVRTGTAEGDILSNCYAQGMLEPGKLLAQLRTGALSSDGSELAIAYRKAMDSKSPDAIDEVCDASYFAHALRLAHACRDPFAISYVRALIDLFNIKTLARAELRETFRARHALVPGGSCPTFETFDPTQIARSYACYGGEERWRNVARGVREGGTAMMLEKTADESFSEWLRAQTMSDLGLASIVHYFHAVKSNAQIVSAISKAKRANMAEKDLRSILRIPTSNKQRS